jgi:hypothetical protein
MRPPTAGARRSLQSTQHHCITPAHTRRGLRAHSQGRPQFRRQGHAPHISVGGRGPPRPPPGAHAAITHALAALYIGPRAAHSVGGRGPPHPPPGARRPPDPLKGCRAGGQRSVVMPAVRQVCSGVSPFREA